MHFFIIFFFKSRLKILVFISLIKLKIEIDLLLWYSMVSVAMSCFVNKSKQLKQTVWCIMWLNGNQHNLERSFNHAFHVLYMFIMGICGEVSTSKGICVHHTLIEEGGSEIVNYSHELALMNYALMEWQTSTFPCKCGVYFAKHTN